MKLELATAVLMAVVLCIVVIYVNLPTENRGGLFTTSSNGHAYQPQGIETQQVISENIQGELKKGSFEIVVEGLKNSTSYHGGAMPYLSMIYENELWKGTMNCKIPTENVTWFTFDVRKLVSANGKVTHISITVTEVSVNTTEQAEPQLSDVSINLKESADGYSPIVNQIGAALPWLSTGLVWMAQGLIIGVPFCLAALGIVMLIDRGIVPLWKRQLKAKNLNKTTE